MGIKFRVPSSKFRVPSSEKTSFLGRAVPAQVSQLQFSGSFYE